VGGQQSCPSGRRRRGRFRRQGALEIAARGGVPFGLAVAHEDQSVHATSIAFERRRRKRAVDTFFAKRSKAAWLISIWPRPLSAGGTWRFPASEPLRLDSGGVIEGLEVAYQTYGAR
jgi:hypothetical protein